MNFLFAASLIFATTHTAALKLLDSGNAKLLAGEDLGEDLLEDDNDEWESDIEFSYKPFQGKCKKGENKDESLDKTPMGNGAGGDDMYKNGEAGTLTVQLCDGVQKSSDILKYCTNPIGGTDVPAPDMKIFHIKDRWLTYLKREERTKECAHYYAKLASMSNKKILAVDAANHAAITVKAFNLAISSCTNQAFIDDATGGTKDTDPDWLCYTTAGLAWAKNDPKVKNMHGEEFEIMATGTFSMLKLETSYQQMVLEVLATIDRSGTRCGATYIQNISLGGQWVQDVGVPHIHIKAAAIGPKAKALQIKFDKEWQHASSHFAYAAVQQGSAKQFTLKLHELTMKVSVDSHRVHENGVKTKRFTNFLNVNFAGISHLSNLSVGGLLGNDSHDAAEKLPEGCGSTNLMALQGSARMWSDANIE